MKYATSTCMVTWSGPDGGRRKTMLEKGDAFEDGDPLVAARPDLFDVEEAEPRRTAPVVETATRAPGEVRRTARAPRR